MINIKDKVYKALTDEGLEVTDIYPMLIHSSLGTYV